ncbi:hypothetical protein TIFTF001_014860 [Ficus carica]|uniref:Uncharacterized protein n=1 Tax=Ficus carica TaxID=3494 RepID=A0AA88AKK3_FICCA|nr:hypothetical protein TIFTF001_014860 [Ficus carica]
MRNHPECSRHPPKTVKEEVNEGRMSWIDNRRCRRGTEDDCAWEFSPPSPNGDEGGGQ